MDSGDHDALGTGFLTNPQPEEELLGGGRRAASPPPEQTPTRLRTKVKPTARDTGLVRNAGDRRGRLLEEVNAAGADSQVVVSSATGQQLQAGTQCASQLFADVPSQSPFLTCRVGKKGRPHFLSTITRVN